MTTIVGSGFVLAIAAPWIVRLLPRQAGWLLAAMPAAAFVWLLVGGAAATERLVWAPSLGVELAFARDGLATLFALLITGIGSLIVVYAHSYLADHPRRGRFHAYLLAFMASMLGLVLADNLLLLFVFWELTSVTSFLLIGFQQERPSARAAALQALYVTAGGGLALLAGLLLVGHIAGTTTISELAAASGVIVAHELYAAALVLILIGAFTKSAQVPFHFWLPNAMEAPTPVSAYLHSSTMVKAGIYLLARLHPSLGGTELWFFAVGGVGALTAVIAAVLAWRQSDLKRILAYSTVSALGMMTLLLGLGSDATLKAAVLLILAHALYKGALFLVAGGIDHAVHSRELSRIGGLRVAMPFTAMAAALAALSMAGVPPFGGFLAKEVMLEATLQASPTGWMATGALFVASALLGATAFLVGLRPFFAAPTELTANAHEGPPALWGGALLLGLIGALAGIVPTWFADTLVREAAIATGAAPSVTPLTLWHGITPPLYLSAAALAGALLLTWRWRTLPRPEKTLGERAYAAVLATVTAVAAWQTRTLQHGMLRHYLGVTVAVVVALGAVTLAAFGVAPRDLTVAAIPMAEAGLVLLVIGGALTAARSRSGLAAVAAIGVVGYGTALLYIVYGAPDLAMTQFVIETLTVILFLFAFRGLPSAAFNAPQGGRWRDIAIAGSAGLLMAVLLVSATTVTHAPPVSTYFVDQSVPLGHGRNVVNVILVDFRALDTLGEIAVLAIAGIGVYALLRLRPEAERSLR